MADKANLDGYEILTGSLFDVYRHLHGVFAPVKNKNAHNRTRMHTMLRRRRKFLLHSDC
jgi:hypothetical protein